LQLELDHVQGSVVLRHFRSHRRKRLSASSRDNRHSSTERVCRLAMPKNFMAEVFVISSSGETSETATSSMVR
jgi:hypothetical protein